VDRVAHGHHGEQQEVTVATTAPAPAQAGGLRQRKKARARAAIQACALRLFAEQGYDETSIEEIAAAAEMSPSTIYRYFPTKPDLVIYDDLDQYLVRAFQTQPADRSAVQAMRGALRDAFGALAGEAFEVQRERERLMRTVPELRAAMLTELVRAMEMCTDLIAARTGRAADDEEIIALSGAVMGVSIAAWLREGFPGVKDQYVNRLDRALARLEDGFRL